jgi:hypothetical protein
MAVPAVITEGAVAGVHRGEGGGLAAARRHEPGRDLDPGQGSDRPGGAAGPHSIV